MKGIFVEILFARIAPEWGDPNVIICDTLQYIRFDDASFAANTPPSECPIMQISSW